MKNFILILFLGILVFGNFSSAINPLKWKRADCGDGIVCGNGCCDIYSIFAAVMVIFAAVMVIFAAVTVAVIHSMKFAVMQMMVD
ncbi:hypothetical protein RCL_jg10314.t1 [Rhizophagus clarus]|uniref:Hydrophobin n=1 Tax=Rhizophagus clarus TaxID=94130 RepID=A0A8H3KRX7_9GLOM|nr:hypothetical protein RCL_jg10314.t1 [Rhizophagus clarus]